MFSHAKRAVITLALLSALIGGIALSHVMPVQAHEVANQMAFFVHPFPNCVPAVPGCI